LNRFEIGESKPAQSTTLKAAIMSHAVRKILRYNGSRLLGDTALACRHAQRGAQSCIGDERCLSLSHPHLLFVWGLDEGKVWVLPFLWVIGLTLSRMPW